MLYEHLSKNPSSQAYTRVFSANFAAYCVKNTCRATARLRIFALSATKFARKSAHISYEHKLLKIHCQIVIASLQQLFHFFLRGDTRIGTGAGIGNGVLCDLGQALQEHVLRHKALLGGVGVRAVVLDAVGDVQRIVHAAQILDEQLDLLVVVGTAQLHLVGDDTIALLGLGVLGVEGDDLGQIHGVGSTMDDVCAVVGKGGTSLVCHGVDDAQQRIGECHTGQALCVVHGITLGHIAL